MRVDITAWRWRKRGERERCNCKVTKQYLQQYKPVGLTVNQRWNRFVHAMLCYRIGPDSVHLPVTNLVSLRHLTVLPKNALFVVRLLTPKMQQKLELGHSQVHRKLLTLLTSWRYKYAKTHLIRQAVSCFGWATQLRSGTGHAAIISKAKLPTLLESAFRRQRKF